MNPNLWEYFLEKVQNVQPHMRTEFLQRWLFCVSMVIFCPITKTGGTFHWRGFKDHMVLRSIILRHFEVSLSFSSLWDPSQTRGSWLAETAKNEQRNFHTGREVQTRKTQVHGPGHCVRWFNWRTHLICQHTPFSQRHIGEALRFPSHKDKRDKTMELGGNAASWGPPGTRLRSVNNRSPAESNLHFFYWIFSSRPAAIPGM